MRTIRTIGLVMALALLVALPGVHAAAVLAPVDVVLHEADDRPTDPPLRSVPERGDVSILITIANRGNTTYSGRIDLQIQMLGPQNRTYRETHTVPNATIPGNGTLDTAFVWRDDERRPEGNYTLRISIANPASTEPLLQDAFVVGGDAAPKDLGDRVLRELGFYVLLGLGIVMFAVVLLVRRG